MAESPYQPSDEEVKRWKSAEPDSATIAIYTKLNELAERYGIQHRDFVAFVRDGDDRSALDIKWEPSGKSLADEERFDNMLRQIGFPDNSTILRGEDYEIIEALDKALVKAPKSRLR